jgi:hypothetical protein
MRLASKKNALSERPNSDSALIYMVGPRGLEPRTNGL